jgi:hypothetical protein
MRKKPRPGFIGLLQGADELKCRDPTKARNGDQKHILSSGGRAHPLRNSVTSAADANSQSMSLTFTPALVNPEQMPSAIRPVLPAPVLRSGAEDRAVRDSGMRRATSRRFPSTRRL